MAKSRLVAVQSDPRFTNQDSGCQCHELCAGVVSDLGIKAKPKLSIGHNPEFWLLALAADAHCAEQALACVRKSACVHAVMAYIVMAYIVMACVRKSACVCASKCQRACTHGRASVLARSVRESVRRCVLSYACLCSYGVYSYGLCSYCLCSCVLSCACLCVLRACACRARVRTWRAGGRAGGRVAHVHMPCVSCRAVHTCVHARARACRACRASRASRARVHAVHPRGRAAGRACAVRVVPCRARAAPCRAVPCLAVRRRAVRRRARRAPARPPARAWRVEMLQRDQLATGVCTGVPSALSSDGAAGLGLKTCLIARLCAPAEHRRRYHLQTHASIHRPAHGHMRANGQVCTHLLSRRTLKP